MPPRLLVVLCLLYQQRWKVVVCFGTAFSAVLTYPITALTHIIARNRTSPFNKHSMCWQHWYCRCACGMLWQQSRLLAALLHTS
jgi:hypothetical protein